MKHNEWTRKKCKLCHVKHTSFVCPQLHYIPLRSVVFLRFQTDPGQIQKRNSFTFKRQKPRISKIFSLKLWKRIFVPIQNALDTRIRKSQVLRMKRVNTGDNMDNEEYQKRLVYGFLMKNEQRKVYEYDILSDYRYYFHKKNPSNLIELNLNNDQVPYCIERYRSF